MIVSCCCRGVQSPNDVIRKIDSHTSTHKPGNNDLSTTTVKINWESAIRKEFPLPVSSVQHSRGRVCCKHKRRFFVSWLRVLTLSVFLSNCQYRKQINDINRNYIKRATDNYNLWGSQTFPSVSSYLPRLFDGHHSNLHGRHHVRTAFK